MITALFVVIVVGALLLHYLFIELPGKVETRAAQVGPAAITLSETLEELPGGVSLQPTFTWTRTRRNGELFLGVHPLLMSLIGPSHELEPNPDESPVKRGDPLLRLRNQGKEIRLFSPVEGRIVEVNSDFRPETGWEGSARRQGSWVYRIRPSESAQKSPGWLSGRPASEWTHQQYRNVRDFLFQTVTFEEVGLAAADGGELPEGVLSQLSEDAWTAFQARFIPSPEENPEP